MADRMRVTSLMGDTNGLEGPTEHLGQLPERVTDSVICAPYLASRTVALAAPGDSRSVYQLPGRRAATSPARRPSAGQRSVEPMRVVCERGERVPRRRRPWSAVPSGTADTAVAHAPPMR